MKVQTCGKNPNAQFVRNITNIGFKDASLLVFIILTATFTCGQCNRSACNFDLTCKRGTLLDICFCCPKCGQDLGESCGGFFNYRGVCGDGLKCTEVSSYTDHYLRIGKCVYENQELTTYNWNLGPPPAYDENYPKFFINRYRLKKRVYDIINVYVFVN
ncbi:unnamed protein product [Gordionus sp. m RMFG-2023]